MAQTKKKRRRKHRGTQGGRIDNRSRARPRNRAEARQQAKARRAGGRSGGAAKRTVAGARQPEPPSWGAAFRKALIAAVIFGVLLAVLGRPVVPSALIAAAMVLFYTPMAYFTDTFFYQRRLRKEEQARIEAAQRKSGPKAAETESE